MESLIEKYNKIKEELKLLIGKPLKEVEEHIVKMGLPYRVLCDYQENWITADCQQDRVSIYVDRDNIVTDTAMRG